jgi:hypothetical protein
MTVIKDPREARAKGPTPLERAKRSGLVARTWPARDSDLSGAPDEGAVWGRNQGEDVDPRFERDRDAD